MPDLFPPRPSMVVGLKWSREAWCMIAQQEVAKEILRVSRVWLALGLARLSSQSAGCC